jgi:Domain of unknown function (DUF4926)
VTINPLVAASVDGPKDFWAGVWIAEDIELIQQGIKNGTPNRPQRLHDRAHRVDTRHRVNYASSGDHFLSIVRIEIVELYEVVELTTDLPGEGLPVGSVGTVVHIFREPDLAYEVEFVDDDGRTIAMVPLTLDKLRPHS